MCTSTLCTPHVSWCLWLHTWSKSVLLQDSSYVTWTSPSVCPLKKHWVVFNVWPAEVRKTTGCQPVQCGGSTTCLQRGIRMSASWVNWLTVRLEAHFCHEKSSVSGGGIDAKYFETHFPFNVIFKQMTQNKFILHNKINKLNFPFGAKVQAVNLPMKIALCSLRGVGDVYTCNEACGQNIFTCNPSFIMNQNNIVWNNLNTDSAQPARTYFWNRRCEGSLVTRHHLHAKFK